MSDITVSRKLELLRQIRARHQQDRYDMFRREQILYGRTSATADDELYELTDREAENEAVGFSTLSLRFLIAAGLFLVIVMCDKSGRALLGIPTEKYFQAISTDYESSIAAWANTAFQKDSDDEILNNPPAGVRP